MLMREEVTYQAQRRWHKDAHEYSQKCAANQKLPKSCCEAAEVSEEGPAHASGTNQLDPVDVV